MITSLEDQFTIFRMHYDSARVFVGADNMVYKVSWGYADKAAKEANELIEQLNLELVAIPTNLVGKNSFVVQSMFSEI